MQPIKRPDTTLIKISEKLSKTINSNDFKEVFKSLGKKIKRDRDFFDSLTSQDFLKICFYTYSICLTKNSELGQKIIDNLSIIYLLEVEDFEEFEQQTCDNCSGDGTVECSYCGGNGDYTCDTCEGSEVISCDDCEGKGTTTDEDGNVEPCENCNGEGEISCPNCTDGRETCMECSGRGYEDCNECDGNGTYETNRVQYYHHIILNWDNRFKDECEIREEMRKSVDYDYEQENQIELMTMLDYETFNKDVVEEDKFYCYDIESLSDSSLRLNINSPYIFTSLNSPSASSGLIK